MEDDVVELWSCLKKSNVKKNNVKKNKKYERCSCDGANALFMIDKRPNLRYLRCLRTKYIEKEKQSLAYDKITSKLFKQVKGNTSKCSDNSQRKRQHEDNLNSNPTNSNIYNKKKFKSEHTKSINENSSQINSTHKLREIIVDGCNVAMAYDSIFSLIVHIIDEFL